MSEHSVLAVVSSHREHQGVPTGFFLPELAYPYHHLTRQGVRVQVASPTGGQTLFAPMSDPRERDGMEYGDLVGLGFVNQESAMELVADTIQLSDVDPDRYATAWVVGGVGPLWDLADNESLHRVLRTMWAAGKPVAAICHGSIALARLEVNGRLLIKGEKVTGFTKQEDLEIEGYFGDGWTLPSYVEDELGAAGGIYRTAGRARPLVMHSAGGRLLTGQNQQSADEFGRALAGLVSG